MTSRLDAAIEAVIKHGAPMHSTQHNNLATEYSRAKLLEPDIATCLIAELIERADEDVDKMMVVSEATVLACFEDFINNRLGYEPEAYPDEDGYRIEHRIDASADWISRQECRDQARLLIQAIRENAE